ncbi:MAG: carbonic anhydrase [Patescibacteria group bacterium]
MSHICKAALVQCMDFRFMKGIRGFLDQNGLTGDCDLVSVAGATKCIVDPATPAETDFLLKQIGLSHDLHSTKHLILMNHLDCGAYGGSKAFASPEEEHGRHVADLTRAGDILKQKYPELEIKKVIAKLDDAGAVTFEHVG